MKIKGKVTRITEAKNRIQLDNKLPWYNSRGELYCEVNDFIEIKHKDNNISEFKLLEKGINMEGIKRLKEKEMKNGDKNK